MTGVPWFKCYPSDFLNGISDLSPNEIAVYTVALMRMYDEGGEIESNIDRIARRCNMRPSACNKAVESLVRQGKLVLSDGLLGNERCKKEIESRQKVSKKSSQSARTRWQKEAEKSNKFNGTTHADASQTQCERNATRGQRPEAREDIDPNGSIVGGGADPSEKIPIQKAFDNYNVAAEELGLPRAKTLSADRRKRLRARLKEHGLGGWNKALVEIEGAPFLLGENDRGWRADLDFLLQPKSLNRLIEGGYSNAG